MTRFNRAISAGITAVFRAAAVSVIITRGTSTADADAVPGTSAREDADENGVTVRYEYSDFLVYAMEYAFDSVEVEPQPGDTITVDSDVYEVVPFGPDTCWNWHDPDGTVRRVHTKLKASE